MQFEYVEMTRRFVAFSHTQSDDRLELLRNLVGAELDEEKSGSSLFHFKEGFQEMSLVGRMGTDGWELATVTPASTLGPSSTDRHWYFKRAYGSN